MVRGKTQMKRIENATSRQVTFSKRRSGLLKKAFELSVLCDAEVALIIFSPKGRLYEFSNSSISKTIERYQRNTKEQDGSGGKEAEENLQHLKEEAVSMSQKIELIEASKRKLFGDCLESCSINELQLIEEQLEKSLHNIRARKTLLYKEKIEQLKEEEKILTEENQKLREKVARLFGPAIFEASKLKVLFLGTDEKKHPGKLPRTYTLTHCDLTSKLTLAISQTINNSQLQGWYHRLQRDEVIAEWKKVRGKMSLHVHCHISGGHFLLDLCASLRFFIFSKELPVVLKAFVHGDGNLFNNYPELEESLVWVYFHSTFPEFNKVECWGPLKAAAAPSGGVNRAHQERSHEIQSSSCDPLVPHPCQEDCTCCFPPMNMHVHDPSLV